MHHNLIIKDGDTTKVVKEVLVDGIQFVDEAPREGSTNFVTSDGVNKAIGNTKESVDEDVQDLQEQIDDIAEKAGSGYIPKGEATVATLNALSGQENGELYTMTDSGTLTDGSLAVVAGDTVAWDATNEVWYKAMDYAPRQYGTNEVHNLPTTITAFRTGDYIAVDGTDTAKMSKDSLLDITSVNALTKDSSALKFGKQIDISSLVSCGGTINNSLFWFTSSTYFGAIIDVSALRGRYIYIRSNLSTTSSYTFTINNFAGGQPVQFATGYSRRYIIGIGDYVMAKVPDDANYLFVYLESEGSPDPIDYRPSELYVPFDFESFVALYGDYNDLKKTELGYKIDGSLIGIYSKILHTYSNYFADISDFDGDYASYIDVRGLRGKKILIVGNDSSESYFTIIKNAEFPQNGSIAAYAQGYTGVQYIPFSAHREVTIPDNATYLYIMRESSGTDVTPSAIILDYLGKFSSDFFGDYYKNKNSESVIDIDTTTLKSAHATIVSATGKWKLLANNYYGSFIDVFENRGNYVFIRARNDVHALFTFLQEPFVVGEETPLYASGYTNWVTIPAGECAFARIPDDAKSLFVYIQSVGIVYTPSQICIVPASQKNLYEGIVGEQDSVKLIRSMGKNNIVVATWNIGHFSNGVNKNSTITPADYAQKLEDFNTIVNGNDVVLFGINEYSSIFGTNSDGQQSTRNKLFYDYGIAYEGVQRNYSCNACFGDTIIENVILHDFECLVNETITHTTLVTAQDYYYLEADLYIKGQLVKFVSTHFAFDNNRPSVLQLLQSQELADKFGSYERVIIAGDFNVADQSDLAPLVSAGFTKTNDGSLITYPSGNKSLDNILVKGLDCTTAQMVDCTGLSDHNMIYSTIKYIG